MWAAFVLKMAQNNILPGLIVDDLNNNLNLDIFSNLNNNYLAPILDDMGISSRYHDLNTFTNLFSTSSNNDRFLILSLNIDSLRSKFVNLSLLLDSLSKKNIKIDAICLQETYFFLSRTLSNSWMQIISFLKT